MGNHPRAFQLGICDLLLFEILMEKDKWQRTKRIENNDKITGIPSQIIWLGIFYPNWLKKAVLKRGRKVFAFYDPGNGVE